MPLVSLSVWSKVWNHLIWWRPVQAQRFITSAIDYIRKIFQSVYLACFFNECCYNWCCREARRHYKMGSTHDLAWIDHTVIISLPTMDLQCLHFRDNIHRRQVIEAITRTTFLQMECIKVSIILLYLTAVILTQTF